MKEITLTRGFVAMVDDEDYTALSAHKWFAKSDHNHTVYAARNCHGRTFRMHRIILNAPSGVLVDHINGNGLDNRRENLRLATPQENSRNRRLRSDSISRFKGVAMVRGAWRMCIKVEGKVVYREFDTETDAAKAYDEWASRYFGQFARLNFPAIGSREA